MVPNATKTLREQREQRLDSVETDKRVLEMALEKEKPLYSNYRTLHRDWLMIANCSTLLGDVTRAREEFAISGLYARSLIRSFITNFDKIEKTRRVNAGHHFRRGFYVALLSGDDRVADGLVEDLLKLSDFFETEDEGASSAYWSACASAAIYFDKCGKSEQYIAQSLGRNEERQTVLVSSVQKNMVNSSQKGTFRTLQSLIDEHTSVFAEGLDWEQELSHATAAHLLIARNRGMDITAAELDSEYVPTVFDEYDIGDNIDLPEPDYVDADLIPK